MRFNLLVQSIVREDSVPLKVKDFAGKKLAFQGH